ncbi:hypothetical protein HLI_14960 [Halobacillus litoralis]|uniref:HTH araC/xylS-type domain-containing protein n=2 Tax=Halobacillus litoralis TaxID=45668 RepID=A0A410MFC2_9BACI|nr:hypothetical protein HLI_14960 [Halobacillus litoralis]
MMVTNYELINLLKDCSISLQTPVLLINHKNKLIYYFPDSFQKPPKVLRDLHKQYIEESRKLPYTLQTFADPYDQQLFLYPLKNQKGQELVIGIGPFLQHEIGRKQVKMHLVVNKLNLSYEGQFIQYFEQLPIMNQVQISSIERLLHMLLPKKNHEKEASVREEPEMRKRYQAYTQTQPSYSEAVASKQAFLQLFKKGDDHAIDAYQSYKKHSISINEDVRASKNQLIRLVTELSWVCEELGAQVDEVQSLSDFYVNFLETKEKIDELQALEINILRSFLERARKLEDLPQHSPLVGRAQRYIFQNLTNDLTLKDIADSLNVNPNYLSGVFTRETGISLTHFINQQRIKEAKELLCISHHSLMEISILLGYNSQSYFTRVFKSVEGIGPKEFRQKYRASE